jgi:hypothetical protein
VRKLISHTAHAAVIGAGMLACSQAASAADAAAPVIDAGPVKLTFGGFIETAAIYRNKDEVADFASNFNNIPFPDTTLAHENELRFSARQSRLSIKAQGPQDGPNKVEAYYEMDFGGSALSSNSGESNSYTPRARHLYLTYSNTDTGFNLVAGQTWSLATLSKNGLMPQQQIVPLTIDGQYSVGTNWTRNPQFRFVEKLNDMLSLGLSIESPQASYKGTAVNGPATTQSGNDSGGPNLNQTATYSLDDVPDVVAKVAVDPGFGHYEVYGLYRNFRDRVYATGVAPSNSSTGAGGIGFGVLLPVVPKVVDLQLTGLGGKGIGRYGSAQLPDATYSASGGPRAIPGLQGLAGVIVHPTSALDIYAYAGHERINNTYNGTVGYGDGSSGNTKLAAACYAVDTNTTAGGAATSSVAGGCNGAQSVTEFTLGNWWSFYKGPVGHLQLGEQLSYIKLTDFAGAIGAERPNTALSQVMVSVRYYPYQ